jgi:uncharacterized protein YdhG (YjbR/CyaY superfamily)
MSEIDTYIDGVDNPSHRDVLRAVRATVARLVPDGNEVMTYGMPTTKENGASLIAYAAAKRHLGLYPCSSLTVSVLLETWPDLDSSKGAVRLPYDSADLDAIIADIIRLRRDEVRTGTHK